MSDPVRFVALDVMRLSSTHNAVETGLLCWYFQKSTFAKDEDYIAPRAKKDRLTFLVCGNASGQYKITMFVFGNYNTSKKCD